MSSGRLLNISEAASLALHACLRLAGAQEGYLSAKRIAQELGVSEHHLTKVLNRLVRLGIVSSSRGAAGGFSLARRPGELSLLEIYEAVEGPLREEHCLLSRPVCVNRRCLFGSLIAEVHRKVKSYLAHTTVKDVLLWQQRTPEGGRAKRKKKTGKRSGRE